MLVVTLYQSLVTPVTFVAFHLADMLLDVSSSTVGERDDRALPFLAGAPTADKKR
ncbi:MAG: hypothetical protein LC791_02140 [Acidobacteria bacterium]|nr:hypothetical protein [Acidobacteriota bacterium]